jgi:hypothetical protein
VAGKRPDTEGFLSDPGYQAFNPALLDEAGQKDIDRPGSAARLGPHSPAGHLSGSTEIIIEIDRRFRILVPAGFSSARLRDVLAAFV